MTKIRVTLHSGIHCVETQANTMLRRITGLILETDDESVCAQSLSKDEKPIIKTSG